MGWDYDEYKSYKNCEKCGERYCYKIRTVVSHDSFNYTKSDETSYYDCPKCGNKKVITHYEDTSSPKHQDKMKYVSHDIYKCSLYELDFIADTLKKFNESSIISKSTSSYERSVRGSKIRKFIKKLEEDKYSVEADILKSLISKNNRFYVSRKTLKAKLSHDKAKKLISLFKSYYFKSTFRFSRECNACYLDLYIKSNKKLKPIETVNKKEEK